MNRLETQPTISNKTKEITILTGKEVLLQLEDQRFATEWDILNEICPWATVFQSREFVSSYYRIYHSTYAPVLVKMEQGGRLLGLLALVENKGKRKKDNYLIGAGHLEVDYHTWISDAEHSSHFITEALKLLQKRFPDWPITLKHLPKNTPMDWLDADPGLKKACILQEFNHPQVGLEDYKVSKRDRKRVNRMKRIGKFEEVVDYQEFEAMIDDMGTKCDFRYAAMYYTFPYKGFPLQKQLLLDMFAKDILRVTVFRTDEETIAGVVTVHGKDHAILGGINFHLPSYSYYSPGYVHFLLLFEHLKKEKVSHFYLTPGDDLYKMRLANKVDKVYKLTVTTNRVEQWTRPLKNQLYQNILEKGYNPYSVKLKIDKAKYLIKELGIKQYLIRTIFGKYEQAPKVMEVNLNQPIKSELPSLRKNNLEQLLAYKFSGKGQTRWEFFEESMRKFESGDHVFSWGEGGELKAYAWYKIEENHAAGSTATMYDFYISDEDKDRTDCFLNAVFSQIQQNDLKKVVVRLSSENAEIERYVNDRYVK